MLQVGLLTVLAIGTAVLLIYHYVSRKYSYFLSKQIPYMKPTFLLGNTGPLVFRTRDAASHMKVLYSACPESKLAGFYVFLTPAFIVRDPAVLKKIAIKDFDYFTDHSPVIPTDNPDAEVDSVCMFRNSLFVLRGQKWRDMRATLSPAFTGSKIRLMFDLVAERARSLAGFLTGEAKMGKKLEFEMKDLLSRYATDVIATAAFGMEMDSMKNRDNEFYLKGKEMVNFYSFTKIVKIVLLLCVPSLMDKLGIGVLDANLLRYFKRIIADNIRQREEHGIVRNDIIDMLMKVRQVKQQKDDPDTKNVGLGTDEEADGEMTSHTRTWTDNELMAQCLAFFFAGYESISTCLTFLAYEIIANPDVQNRLHQEIVKTNESLNGEPLSYETLLKMEYLDMVVSEALRKWPPNVYSDRFCTKDYTYDDGAGTRFVIEKNQVLVIPIIAIHNDPKYYPNPDRFDPERFSAENKAKLNPDAYIPFGVGPRNCIGSRLALMEVKAVIYYLMKDFSFEPTEKTQIPVRLSRKGYFLQAKSVWAKLEPRFEIGSDGL
ncbi:probable cytochrome P450 9f2 [Topomyia yanbarensis]|uniref:probable cytochrome P450 9f2 n=1 Tax=Topomyia yanbarensis TaxID=2498891 RepID=UPI00273B570D|nr:probable cytochrome P450 9f2 [Topomyia yanbarensis]